MVVHHVFGYAQTLYLSIRRVRDLGGVWVVPMYAGKVPRYIGAGECISCPTVDG
jgi:hypothetical protein